MNSATTYRSHTCNELRMDHIGQTVKLSGFMDNLREVSANLAFVVLRDFYGTTQIVVEDEAQLQLLKSLNKESTLCITGTVRERASKNPSRKPARSSSSHRHRGAGVAASTTSCPSPSPAAVRQMKAQR